MWSRWGAIALFSLLAACKPEKPGPAPAASSAPATPVSSADEPGAAEDLGPDPPLTALQWCEGLLRQDGIPLHCSPEGGAMTPAQRAACEAEDRAQVIEARFTATRSASGDEAIGLEIPALTRSLRLISGELRHPFVVQSFPRLRHGTGKVGGDDRKQVDFCSAEGRFLVARLTFAAGRLVKRTIEAIALPPKTRVRIPTFSFTPPGWRPFALGCDGRCAEVHHACTQGCERGHADGWGVLSTTGRGCVAACEEARKTCQQRCPDAG